MRTAKWSRETWVAGVGENLGRKLRFWRGLGAGCWTCGLGSIWGYLESQGRGEGIPGAGVELAVMRYERGSAFRELGAEAHLTGGKEGLSAGQGEEGGNGEKGWLVRETLAEPSPVPKMSPRRCSDTAEAEAGAAG